MIIERDRRELTEKIEREEMDVRQKEPRKKVETRERNKGGGKSSISYFQHI